MSITNVKAYVITHVVRLKMFRLKVEGGAVCQKNTIAVLWRKYLILASNMALKYAFS